MTKAERIFKETHLECRSIIKHWGYTENSRLNGLCVKDDEHICMRTVNAIQKLIDSELRCIAIAEKYGVTDIQYRRNAMAMVQRTLDKEKAYLETLGC